MSFDLIKKVNDANKKAQVVDVRSGDTVRVTQKIKEGNKERLQTFEGVVIRCDRKDSLSSRISVRKITSGVGVEKSYLLHSPLVEKIEVVKRAKVRRNYLSYLRDRSGKSARLSGKDFDKSINEVHDEKAEAEAERMKAEKAAEAEAKAAEKAEQQAELDKKAAEVEAAHAANEN
jgi:large subunit ribosomal protein L19